MRLTFRGGIHPLHREEEGKILSANVPIANMPAPKIVKIPLSQNLGAPSVPVVEAGSRVRKGQLLGKANGFVSAPVHSSVAGTLLSIEEIPGVSGNPEMAFIVENDFSEETDYAAPRDYRTMGQREIIAAIRDGGIVGMGGAAFPTHVKLSVPPQKKVDTLIVNGAECEPFLTADQRLMVENPEGVVYGVEVMMRALGVKQALIGIEDNKPDAIAAMEAAVTKTRHVKVKVMETKYPQGYEKTLVYALTGRVVPAGGLPMDVQVVVVNAASCASTARLFREGKPSLERICTVTGAVNSPCNLRIRVGTSLNDAIAYAGGFSGTPLKIISGGPMMGKIVPTTECVVTKSTSGILVLDDHYTRVEHETGCIRCGRCQDACPMNLAPVRIMDASKADDFAEAELMHAMDCMSCGTCSYICPANRPLAQSIAFAKGKIQEKRIRERQEAEQAEKEAQAAGGDES